jgi:hypothetical protein
VLRFPYLGPDALTRTIVAEGIDTLYLCPALDRELADIKPIARKHSVLTLAGRLEQVRNGLSVGVFALEGRATIVVNLVASKEEGAAFGSDILRLAKIVKSE